MLDISKLKKGDKVYYQPDHYKENGEYENGIVKSFPTHTNESVFVVYNCGGEWASFENYTAALTNARDLHTGWNGQ